MSDEPRPRIRPTPLTLVPTHLLLSSLLFICLSGACARSAALSAGGHGIAVELLKATQDRSVGPGAVDIQVRDAQGNPVEGAQVSLRGEMSHAGMIPVGAMAQDLGAGRYRAVLEWTMAGDWIVTVVVELPDGRVVQEQFDLNIEPSSP